MCPDRFTTAQGEFAGVILVGRLMENLVAHMRLDIGSQVTIYDLEGIADRQHIRSPGVKLISCHERD